MACILLCVVVMSIINLGINPCQIPLVECPNERPYLEHAEDIYENHQGGLKGHNQKPKVDKQFANPALRDVL